jgi:ABC-type Zn uptake system ZnuABC Zn-binding protein ZnuA
VETDVHARTVIHPRPRSAARHPARFGAVLLALAAVSAVIASACAGSADRPGASSDQLRVVATTTVLADLVAHVGGSRVQVDSLVPKGGEVHTFDPRPSNSIKVSNAELIVMNGLGLDDWLGRLAVDTGTSAPIVRLAEDLPGVSYITGGATGSANPHLWLDVANAERYVDRIAEALGRISPADAATFAGNAASYKASLGKLDGWVRERISTIPEDQRAFVSFHDALPYFARAYGLRIAGVVVPAPGQDPSAGEVASLVSAIRSAGVKAVFSEAQFSPQLADAIAAEAGATVVADLYTDTLGDPPADTYEGIIRWDVDRIVGALR